MKAYSMDLRERILADADAGLGTKAVAAKYRVSESWVRRLKQVRRETGRIGPKPPSPGRTRKLAGRDAELRDLVTADPDATLADALDRVRLSFKKKSSGRPSRIGRT